VKVVLDTNVILAAFATRGLCEAVMTVCLDQHEIVLSEPILDEVRRNLVAKLKLPAARADDITTFLREHAQLVEPAAVPAKTCRDAGDRLILGTAVAGAAEALIAGDTELLNLKKYERVLIHSPRAFYDAIQ
jgi:putative PIN family toxin of toxin-antitoxin system